MGSLPARLTTEPTWCVSPCYLLAIHTQNRAYKITHLAHLCLCGHENTPIVKHALYQSTAAPEYGAWWRTASRPSCVHLFRVIVVSCHCVWLALSRCDCCPCVLTCMCSGQCLQIEISASDRPSLQIDARLDFLTISGRFFSSKVLLGLYVMSLAKPSLHFCRDRTVLPRAQSLVACVRLSE